MSHPSLKIVVIDYNGGNLASAQRAALYAAQQINLSVDVEISNHPDTILNADRIILPGQGAFADCMNGLKNIPHLLTAIEQSTDQGTPFLGICVGMQLMAQRGLEHHITEGLGWVKGEIAQMKPKNLPLPQMGWNELQFKPNQHPILEGIDPGNHAYFVHSYALTNADSQTIIATTDYDGVAIPAIIAQGNKVGTQFHVEKSQEVGLRILANFLTWKTNSAYPNHSY
ncbi:Imidazoleglycerol phosphate synthase glutamine amidotransferase subunit HisH (HisH) (PDB:1OX4) [Commensalibacter communis]|uniref:Imidazole glycerol phosphate synthase subunit HisH n=1 Tax=Commensalibacter communis TaxID=2972786 RepID=A0A9W4TLI1_9PROT|nr:imidazole glycerol phosphate synthase subunit HisH [Commensalibacter communis]CAI3926497.1 Imidazoleglycerol phosphate synthase glutamine amidotransferase subunit HisH (HisH) (PDB:1OX4) [Commensalibacter communis]CAI3928021.1 Imidazoleglycerol phosphate synthase glutamine amidotransferase subunit HisH (HisH) (PDB:1OX4) [Commensalibacter communis]CAI3934472.1 Imidazoleglycerol phosphate synthase glutamine amidotransferase subunit HisH (HisH) (PDB:1OX4) [Commensalibacter communis]CAI3934998.1 